MSTTAQARTVTIRGCRAAKNRGFESRRRRTDAAGVFLRGSLALAAKSGAAETNEVVWLHRGESGSTALKHIPREQAVARHRSTKGIDWLAEVLQADVD